MAKHADAYEHDVYLSFAPFDDKARGEDEGWVSRFRKRLAAELLQQLGHGLRVAGAGADDDAAVRGSAVLVVLLSAAYGRSGRERDLQIFGGGPVVPILLQNLLSSEQPAACRGADAVVFCDTSETEYGVRLEPGSPGFERALRTLGERLTDLLKRPPEAPKDDGPFTVFLAATSDDLARDARRLTKELGRNDVQVTGGIPPPRSGNEHAAAVRDALGRADLAVHLLGPYPGGPVDGASTETTYPVEQLRLGRVYDCPQLVLLSETLDDLDEDDEDAWYHAVLDEFERAERDAASLELVRAGRHRYGAEVLDRLKRLGAARRTAASAGVRKAFVDVHQSDLSGAAELLNFLDKNDVEPIAVPVFGLSPSEGMERFERNLQRAQIFFMVFGAVAQSWVEQRLEAALKLVLSRKLKTRMCVCVPSEARRGDVPFANLVDVVVASDPASIERVLRKLDG